MALRLMVLFNLHSGYRDGSFDKTISIPRLIHNPHQRVPGRVPRRLSRLARAAQPRSPRRPAHFDRIFRIDAAPGRF